VKRIPAIATGGSLEEADQELVAARSRAFTGVLRAVIDVTGSGAGSIVAGTAKGIASISFVTPAAPAFKAVRVTFAYPFPDANYAVALSDEYLAGENAAYLTRQLKVFARNAAYVDIGWMSTSSSAYDSIDSAVHRFEVVIFK
jgi:hypothetical protein